MANQKEYDPYRPIDCSLHDQLLARATLRTPTSITYRSNGGDPLTARGVIEDVFTRGGAEFLRLKGGIEIRLDKIASIDDVTS